MASDISETFAVVLAGQVAAGLTPGEGQVERMRASLLVIGLMVRNTANSQLVNDVLAMVDHSVVTQYDEHGSTRVERRE
jgi:hypothetical protein